MSSQTHSPVLGAKDEGADVPKQAFSADQATAEEIAAPPETVNMTEEEEMGAATDKDQSESGKLRTLLGILKRMVGVKDMAAIRLSLPANLLEPVPNLEYWNYLDRGDLFTNVADLDDPLDRMLATLRFTFTKEIKYIKGKVCKPYNSILGEHFRCHWDVDPLEISEDGNLIPVQAVCGNPTPLPLASSSLSRVTSSKKEKKKERKENASEDKSRPASIKGISSESGATGKKGISKLLGSRKNKSKEFQSNGSVEATSPLSIATQPSTDDDAISIKTIPGESGAKAPPGRRRICFLTEQVSHHPPISSFFAEAKEAGVQLYGVDQLGAKFTGTNVKVFPGDQNKGIFLRLTEKARCGAAGEEYQITHPTATINGIFRGNLWVAICDQLYITCRGGVREGEAAGGEDGTGKGSRLRTIVEYKDESWVMKAKYALEGCIYEYDPAQDDAEEYSRIKQVPPEKVVATFEGCWRGKIFYKRKGDKEPRLLINLEDLGQIAKAVRPLESQDAMESRRIWEPVTKAIHSKEFSEATKFKQKIEQKQRDAAAERKKKGEEFVPTFFDADISDGRPKLTAAGREALDGEEKLVGYTPTDAAAAVGEFSDGEEEEDDDDFEDAQG
ncbi:hypothetical protein IE53DRAFT_399359 [Violaceomyces palustris]|uniref:Uncharacterized protein n=1 Tax=Violaceomyces palustris TaxID=1673888 RepID=A0ACD0NS25_9BASI|nr:hypothetical protein IE53DRAFT_399359 [Violaceomyces palustris]